MLINGFQEGPAVGPLRHPHTLFIGHHSCTYVIYRSFIDDDGSVCCGGKIVINVGSTFHNYPTHGKFTTIWNPTAEAHIENRRLLNLVVGVLELKEWNKAIFVDVRCARASCTF
jgi:hypothetical protein